MCRKYSTSFALVSKVCWNLNDAAGYRDGAATDPHGLNLPSLKVGLQFQPAMAAHFEALINDPAVSAVLELGRSVPVRSHETIHENKT